MELCKSDIEMDSDDDAFRKFIVVCEDVDDKENVSQVSPTENSTVKRQQKTKKEQFDKIIEFINVYNEDTTAKSVLDDLWERLSVDLNMIGPPSRTAMQWRRVWSAYKYNTKRAETSSQARGGTSSQTQNTRRACTNTNNFPGNQRRPPLRERPQTDERVVTLLSEIAQQQSKIIHNQEATMAIIETSNELLARIAEKSERGDS